MNALETTTITQATEIAGVAPVAKPRGTRRTRLASILFATVVGIGMFGSQAAVTSAASVGAYAPAYATCNYRNHTISLIAQAGAAPGFATQTVSYRYTVYDATTRRVVPGLGPTGFGTIATWRTYVSNGITYVNNGTVSSPASVYALTPGHRYTVATEYFWYIGGTWYTVAPATTSYGNVGIWSDPTVQTSNGCIA